MKSPLIIFALLACFAVNSYAQSGRVKVTPTPTPTPHPSIAGPSVLTVPQAEWPKKGVKIEPTPTPQSDDVIKVESALVPIPVSVTDQNGRPVTNLKLEDFVLTIDGKPAEISELARSETP